MEPRSFIGWMKFLFGNGVPLQQFAADLKSLSDTERQWYRDELTKSGHPIIGISASEV